MREGLYVYLETVMEGKRMPLQNQSTIVLKVSNISKRFPGTQALLDVNFNLHKGEIHAIAGENGAGKSTFVKILAGLIKKDSGTILRNGIPVEIHTNLDAAKLGINFVHQDFGLIPQVKIVDNFYLGTVFPIKKGRIQWHIAHTETSAWLNKFGLSKIDPRKPVSFLSVAQAQMFTIARAFSRNAKILILDEPTASLTSEEKNVLFHALLRIRDQGISIVYITHKLEEIFEIADRITVMKDGKVINTSRVNDITVDGIIKFMTGKDIGAKYPKRNLVIKDTIALQIRHLNSKKVKNITFNIYKGEIFGIIGLVGSGRTEFARLLCGVDPSESGEITLFNRDIKFHNIHDAVESGICLVPEDRRVQGLIMNFSVCENTVLTILKRLCHGFLLHIDKRKAREITQEFIDKFSIKIQNMDQKVKFLSGGNQQKVVLSKWLSTQVRVIVLDEVTKGIDVATKTEIYKILNRLAEQGMVIILISSEVPEVLGVCNRIGIFYKGQLQGILEAEKTNEEEILKFMFGRSGA